jgi:hypothetical protein
MRIFHTELKVVRRDWTTYGRGARKGSGYCKDQGTKQYLVKSYFLFGKIILSRDIDVEDVPLHYVIHHDIFGDCGFKSKFREYMK